MVMKKAFLILLIIKSFSSQACDVCGCANGASFFGILPQSHFRFGGLRYQNKTFVSHVKSNLLRSEENFQAIEPWIRLYPIKKTQLIFIGSYQSNLQTLLSSGEKKQLQGFGDITAIAHFNVLNTFMDSSMHKSDYIWLLGGGIKLPTGKYEYGINSDEVANPNFQLGTGSFDYIINSIYTLRKSSIGLNLDLSYKINGTNSNAYKFANKARAGINVFSQNVYKNLTLMPNLGILAEHSGFDLNNKVKNRFSGGYLVNGTFGFELYYKKITTGFLFQKPILQNLSGGELKLKNSFTSHLTLLF